MYVIALQLTNDTYEPVAWTNEKLSVREIRNATKNLRKQSDVVSAILMEYDRFYKTKSEAQNDVPEL